MNRIFGPEWAGTPAAECHEQIDTPVGQICAWCDEAFAEGDSGIVQPLMKLLDGGGYTVEPIAYHHACHLRHMLGGVMCQLGHRHVPGQGCDDPTLTKRQAAELAVQFFATQGKRH